MKAAERRWDHRADVTLGNAIRKATLRWWQQSKDLNGERKPLTTRKGVSVGGTGGWNGPQLRAAWPAQGPQARPGAEDRQQLGRPVRRSLLGAQTWLRGGPQASITQQLQGACGQQAGDRVCQSLTALPATIPSCSWLRPACQHRALSLLISLAEPICCATGTAQKVSANEFFTARLGQPGLLGELGTCWVARGTSHMLLYFSKGLGEAQGPEKPLILCLLIWNHGNSMTHFAQDG